MLNLNDLWIGDKVRVHNTNSIGSFEGLSPTGLAIVKLKSGTFHLKAEDLSLHVEPKKKNLWVDQNAKTTKQPAKEIFSDEIDLHIEQLDPELIKALPQVILNKQITAAKNYLDQAIKNYSSTVKIIHGKGTGQLKTEVYHVLKSYTEVYHTVPANDGGAVEVLFKY